MSKNLKIMLLSVTLIVTASQTSALDINSSEDLNYYNNDVLDFQVQQNGQINAQNDLNINNNRITNFFGSACPSGEVVADVNDDGSYGCVNIDTEIQDTYVNRNGDTMTGNLDINGNILTDTTGMLNLGGGDVEVSSGDLNINGGDINMKGNSLTGTGGIETAQENFIIQNSSSSNDMVRISSSEFEIRNRPFVVNMSSYAGPQIISRGSTWSYLDFGDSQDPNVGGIRYRHGEGFGGYSNAFTFRTNSNAEQFVIDGDGNVIIPEGNLDMENNNINDFFGSECSGGNVATHINDDGSIDCVDATQEVQDDFVNRNGDTMTGSLDMQGNNLRGPGKITFADNNGDGIQFSIDEPSGSADNLELAADGNTILDLRSSGGVILPNGDLNMEGNSITNFFGSACPSGEVVADVENNGNFGCVNIDTEIQDTYVNRNGDTMTGQLDLQNNNIIGIGNLGGSGIVNSNNIASNAVTPNELDETQTYSLSWNNLGISQSDITVSDLGAADANLDMNGNSITNFFGGQCSSGQVVAHVNDDGSLDCVDATGEVQDDFVSRNGDTMTGELEMTGGPNFVNQMSGSNVREGFSIEDTSGSTLGWFVSDGNEDDVLFENKKGGSFSIGLAGTGSRELTMSPNGPTTFNTAGRTALELEGNQNVNIPNGNLDVSGDITGSDWGSLDISQSDITTNDLGAADSNINLNSNQINNVGSGNINLGDGSGDINMNGQRIYGSSLGHFQSAGVSDTLTNAQNNLDTLGPNSLYVADDVSVGGDFIGTGGDVAENIKTEEDRELEPGTVTTISGDVEVKPATEKRDTGVAGVVSTDPGVKLAKERDGVPLALSGVVPVKTTVENGEIEPGDLLTTSSEEGYAMKCQDSLECHGAILGKAMGSLDEKGKVETLVTLG